MSLLCKVFFTNLETKHDLNYPHNSLKLLIIQCFITTTLNNNIIYIYKTCVPARIKTHAHSNFHNIPCFMNHVLYNWNCSFMCGYVRWTLNKPNSFYPCTRSKAWRGYDRDCRLPHMCHRGRPPGGSCACAVCWQVWRCAQTPIQRSLLHTQTLYRLLI